MVRSGNKFSAGQWGLSLSKQLKSDWYLMRECHLSEYPSICYRGLSGTWRAGSRTGGDEQGCCLWNWLWGRQGWGEVNWQYIPPLLLPRPDPPSDCHWHERGWTTEEFCRRRWGSSSSKAKTPRKGSCRSQVSKLRSGCTSCFQKMFTL